MNGGRLRRGATREGYVKPLEMRSTPAQLVNRVPNLANLAKFSTSTQLVALVKAINILQSIYRVDDSPNRLRRRQSNLASFDAPLKICLPWSQIGSQNIRVQLVAIIILRNWSYLRSENESRIDAQQMSSFPWGRNEALFNPGLRTQRVLWRTFWWSKHIYNWAPSSSALTPPVNPDYPSLTNATWRASKNSAHSRNP